MAGMLLSAPALCKHEKKTAETVIEETVGLTPSALRVLSYNIQGLPAPLRKGKVPYFEKIAEILIERRTGNTHPHIVLLQEAFDKDAALIAEKTGYKYILKGPDRKSISKKGKAHWSMLSRKEYAVFSDPQKIAGSGLYILSDYPILEAQYKAFDSDMCAGFDCLSNKSILFARVKVPGLDDPIDVVNTHFNSHKAAKAPSKTKLKAHKKQTETLQWFLEKVGDGNALILGGDFNTKLTARYEFFRNAIEAEDAAEVCVRGSIECSVEEKTKLDEILYRTNDKQFFANSSRVSLTPMHIVRNFTEMLGGKPLSDHLGYEVHYQLGR